jgi:Protein of unknown function (DUF1194)
MARWLTALAAVALLVSSPARAAEQFDLLLVLAVDTSGSVDDDELALQLSGIAAAFRDDAVIDAALSGPRHRIAVNLVNWSDAEYQKFSTGWISIDTESAARAFAGRAEGFTKRLGGATGIGSAIAFGIGLIGTSGLDAPRKVIDVSGDGIEAWQMHIPTLVLETVHPLREAAGITVNGLAIRNDFQFLDRYYRDFVIGGPGSFVMDATDYRAFPAAMRKKLLRELTPLTASLGP